MIYFFDVDDTLKNIEINKYKIPTSVISGIIISK